MVPECAVDHGYATCVLYSKDEHPLTLQGTAV